MARTFTLLTLIFALCGCLSVPELLERGEYAKAYDRAYGNYADALARTRRKPPKPKFRERFLLAYAALQSRDYARATELAARPDPARHVALHGLYSDLYARSVAALDLAPLPDSIRTGIPAPAELERRREEHRRAAGEYYLAQVAELRPAALEGDKPSARSAYALYQRAEDFLPERSAAWRRERARLRDIGTLRVQLYAEEGEGQDVIRSGIERLAPIRREWAEVLTRPTGARLDLEAAVTYDRPKESGLRETCSTEEYTKKILERVEKKKVREKVNDSTWVEKIVEIKHYNTVYATVTECTQSVMVCAVGHVTVYPLHSDEAVFRREIVAVNSWSNTYRYGSGDRRALPAFANSGGRQSPPGFAGMLRSAQYGLGARARRVVGEEYAPRERRRFLDFLR